MARAKAVSPSTTKELLAPPIVDDQKFVSEMILHGVIVYTYTGIEGAKEVAANIKRLYPKATAIRVLEISIVDGVATYTELNQRSDNE